MQMTLVVNDSSCKLICDVNSKQITLSVNFLLEDRQSKNLHLSCRLPVSFDFFAQSVGRHQHTHYVLITNSYFKLCSRVTHEPIHTFAEL
jgi:hypothetical protein